MSQEEGKTQTQRGREVQGGGGMNEQAKPLPTSGPVSRAIGPTHTRRREEMGFK